MKKWPLLLALVMGATCEAAPVGDLAFSIDGSVLASTGHKAIILHSATDARPVEKIECEFPRVSSLAFHPDGRALAVGGGTPGENGRAVLLDWKKKVVLRQLPDCADMVTSVAISADGLALGVASADGSASVFSITNAAANSIRLIGHSGPVLAIAFSSNTEIVVTASADRSLKVWSTQDGKLLRSFSHHTEAVQDVVFRPTTGNEPIECASASEDQTVRIWQPAIGRMVRIVRNHDEPIFAIAYSQDGSALFSGGKTGIVRRIDVGSDEILQKWQAHVEPIYSMAVSPDGRALATGDWNGVVKIWSREKYFP